MPSAVQSECKARNTLAWNGLERRRGVQRAAGGIPAARPLCSIMLFYRAGDNGPRRWHCVAPLAACISIAIDAIWRRYLSPSEGRAAAVRP